MMNAKLRNERNNFHTAAHYCQRHMHRPTAPQAPHFAALDLGLSMVIFQAASD